MGDDRPYRAFHLGVTRFDDSEEIHYLVIERSRDDAVATARQKRGVPCVTQVIDEGDVVMERARRLGVADGEALEV